MLSLISSLVTNPTALIFLLLILGGLFRKWKMVKHSLWGMAVVRSTDNGLRSMIIRYPKERRMHMELCWVDTAIGIGNGTALSSVTLRTDCWRESVSTRRDASGNWCWHPMVPSSSVRMRWP